MALDGFDTLRYEVADSGVATITLDQPDNRNALSTELLDDLTAALMLAREDDGVRSVVLTSRSWRCSAVIVAAAVTSSRVRRSWW